MQHTLIAVFDNRADADRAQDDLLMAGFKRDCIKISNSDPTGITDSVSGSTTATAANTGTEHEGLGASIKHFFADIFGTDNSEHAQRYSDAVSRGHHVLTVTADDEPEVERAADIVERHGPVDIDEKAAEWAGGAAIGHPESMRMSGAGGMQQSGATSLQSEGDRNLFAQQSLNEDVPMGQTYQEPMSRSGESLQGSTLGGSQQSEGMQLDSTRGSTLRPEAGVLGAEQRDTGLSGSLQRDTSSQAIPVVEERLKVGKREVQRGGVRVFSRVVEQPVNESIGLREEHVNVERHRVDQPLSPGDTSAFKEQTIEMRETAEEPVVEKSARVVEEVVVGKQVSQREQQIRDTVRHTEVQVENLGARASMLSDDDYFRRHWTSNYGSSGGSYGDYAPAYSFGSDMARDTRYRGRKWDEVESDLKSSWEARHPGQSTWERFKASVREGWDRITNDEASRSHWNSNYATSGGSYDDYAPAYDYGYQMARSDKYRGRKWDEVESDLRSDWDSRYPGESGASSWERFKMAVRNGWDRLTS
ncbi:YsnF/AvaK domain-containing protein [Massilia agilis]|uniref:YsnF/AvaK domain-containing protein n=1 Tax=Massilia agilis TaxID=1811226 RepID=A0ABT2D527_9BURK|nr:YsnF/AvaK domain-containing protein [Massilia agilis]MCS0806370.1 YsnF/AvaK domain-containing protein [Massilia agilis]